MDGEEIFLNGEEEFYQARASDFIKIIEDSLHLWMNYLTENKKNDVENLILAYSLYVGSVIDYKYLKTKPNVNGGKRNCIGLAGCSSGDILNTCNIRFDKDTEKCALISEQLIKCAKSLNKEFWDEEKCQISELVFSKIREEHLRMKASEERDKIRQEFEKANIDAKVMKEDLLKKISNLEEQLNEKTKEVEHFKELYRKTKESD